MYRHGPAVVPMCLTLSFGLGTHIVVDTSPSIGQSPPGPSAGQVAVITLETSNSVAQPVISGTGSSVAPPTDASVSPCAGLYDIAI